VTNEPVTMAPERRWIVIVAAVVALAISGGVLYVRLADRASTPDAPVVQPSQSAIDVAADKLAKRLAGKDGTADDWALLARSYREMKRYPEALDAYDRALAKAPGNAALAAEAADVRKSAGIAAPR
jgi:cytochrome c-type biogenesis protein CcmH/NrfG